MDIHIIMWFAFWLVVSAALFVDLIILNKHNGDVSMKEAAKIVILWVSLALAFGVAVYFAFGREKALEYVTVYVVEYSLSIDNMFVFLIIFAYFAIPKKYQPKVLIYGILGAVILRFLFIFIGVQLISSFTWIIYVFGAILIYTALKMIFIKKGEVSPEKNIAYRIIRKLFPFKQDSQTGKFFIKENGVLYATPMLAAVAVVEMSDIIFAIDSIPAALSISKDTFIVYTSNIFAIIGLRSLYFLLSNLAAKFKFLKYGVAVILLFVGVKMTCSHFFHIPIAVSLGVIVSVLLISAAVSVQISKKTKVS